MTGRLQRASRLAEYHPAMAYWRFTSQTAVNIIEALDAGVWGENRASTLAPVKEGDRVAFYSTQQRKGFVATGTVIGPMIKSSEIVWMTGIYPFRVPIRTDVGPRQTSVDPAAVLEQLGQRRFEHAAPRKGVIPLSPSEFAAIEGALRQ